jgi:hypothetical protein
MCAFMFNGFLKAPLIRDFRYILRIDDDSCIEDHIHYDMFAVMKSKGIAYGFNDLFLEAEASVRGLFEFSSNYMKINRLPWANSPLMELAKKGVKKMLPAFSTNFELIDTKRYLMADIQKFGISVINSSMIFHRRWGDAPLRYMLAQMFWGPNEVMHFCDFSYSHR